MKKRTLKISVFIAALVAGTLSYYINPALDGAIEAKFDAHLGRHNIRVYGEGREDDHPQWRLLKERYGIEQVVVDRYIITLQMLQEADAYNKVADAEIKKKFGDDVFERTVRESLNYPAAQK